MRPSSSSSISTVNGPDLAPAFLPEPLPSLGESSVVVKRKRGRPKKEERALKTIKKVEDKIGGKRRGRRPKVSIAAQDV